MIKVQIKEELEEGLKDTDYDPNKALIHNFHFNQYQLTHLGSIVHLRDRMLNECSQ
jgi:hypothetical protein